MAATLAWRLDYLPFVFFTRQLRAGLSAAAVGFRIPPRQRTGPGHGPTPGRRRGGRERPLNARRIAESAHERCSHDRQRSPCSLTIIANVRELAALGWTRHQQQLLLAPGRRAAITVSGCDKGRLVPADIMVVDRRQGRRQRPPALRRDPAPHPAVPVVPGRGLHPAYPFAQPDHACACSPALPRAAGYSCSRRSATRPTRRARCRSCNSQHMPTPAAQSMPCSTAARCGAT